MKRATALFLCLLLLTLCPTSLSALATDASMAASVLDTEESPVIVFHEFLGIPWGASAEEFLKAARQKHDLNFEWSTDNEKFTAYVSSDEAVIDLLGYPVQLKAFFLDQAVVDRPLSWVFIEFQNTGDFHSVVSAWLMAEDVFHRLYTEYGAPWDAYAAYSGSTGVMTHPFELPITEGRLDISKLTQYNDIDLRVRARFDNISFFFNPFSATMEQPALTLTLSSPEIMQNPSRTFSTLDSLDNYPTPQPTPSPTPVPTPTPGPTNRVDVDLW